MFNKNERVLVLSMILALAVGFWGINKVNAAGERICVCHVEDKKNNTGHVIEVDESSLGGHLKHGDECEDCSNLSLPCTVSSPGSCL
jgi:hypothetical protein